MRFTTLAASFAALITLAPGIAAAQMTTVPPGEARIIDKHGVCRVVENEQNRGIMVPHRDRKEWSFGANAFLAKQRGGIDTRGCDYRVVDFDTTTSHYSPVTSTCLVDVQGDVWCWGADLSERNYRPDTWGVLASEPPHRTRPRRIPGIPPMDKVATSGFVACGATSGSGEIWCWGVNLKPFKRSGVSGITSLKGSYYFHSSPGAITSNYSDYVDQFCGVRSDNTLWCWFVDGLESDNTRRPFEVAKPRSGAIQAFDLANGQIIWSIRGNTYLSYMQENLSRSPKTFRLPNDPRNLVNIQMTNRGLGSRDGSGVPDSETFQPGCGIQSDGDLYCWGGSTVESNRKSGIYDTIWTDYPIKRNGQRSFNPSKIDLRNGDVEHIVHVGSTGVCVIYADRKSWCDRPKYNDHRDNTWTASHPMSRTIETQPSFVKVLGDFYGEMSITWGGDDEKFHARGRGYACGLDRDGGMWCRGENSGAQLANGNRTDQSSWQLVRF